MNREQSNDGTNEEFQTEKEEYYDIIRYINEYTKR